MYTEMNIKRVDLVFENCEVISLSNDMFKALIFDDIVEQKIVNCYQYENGENQLNKCCKYMSIDINKKGYEQKMEWEGITLEERLKRGNDITYIDLIYEDNSEERIDVIWNEENDFNNKYQRVFRIDEDTISVVIENNNIGITLYAGDKPVGNITE